MNLGIFLFLTILIVVNIIIGYVIASLLGVGPDLRTVIRSLMQRDWSFLRMPGKWLEFALSKLTFLTKFVKLKKQDVLPTQNVETTEEKLQRFSEIESLCCTKQFDSQNFFEVLNYLQGFSCANRSHTYMIFLA